MFEQLKFKKNSTMPINNTVKAILFDSGHVLNKPKTGNWFIPPRFNEVINISKINIKSILYRYTMYKAKRYLMHNHNINTEKEEYNQFKNFYSILLKKYIYSNINDHIIDFLANDNVYNDNKFVFFDDVEKSIIELSNKYKLGVVSVSWPSLERVYRNRGLRDYFSTFIISSKYNQYNSKKLLLQIALKELKIEPTEAIFIDDREKNLITAEKLRITPIKMNRYNNKSKSQFFTIHSLKELKDLIL
jgi:putative hydrolase of the HAD superfamily